MSQFMLLLTLLVILLPLAAAKLLLDYRSERNRGTDEVTLTVGELERLVRRYVEDAAEPLRRRIEELERARARQHRGAEDSTRDPFPLIDDPTLEGEKLRSRDDPRDDRPERTA